MTLQLLATDASTMSGAVQKDEDSVWGEDSLLFLSDVEPVLANVQALLSELSPFYRSVVSHLTRSFINI